MDDYGGIFSVSKGKELHAELRLCTFNHFFFGGGGISRVMMIKFIITI